MRSCATVRGMLSVALSLWCAAVSAAEFWSYQYKNIDVTVAGRSADAVDLAHNIARYDVALSQVLHISATYPVTAHIFMLTGEQLKQLTGFEDGASFKAPGFDFTVVSDLGAADNRYWGAYFGYAGGLLLSERATRYPYWFMHGVPYAFAEPEFGSAHIQFGRFNAGHAALLLQNRPIPMRVFLSLRQGDPQLKGSGPYANLYRAQSWFVTRDILVEGRYRTEFARYLSLLSEGTSEREAFSSSFAISYEDLDKSLEADMRAPKHMYRVPVPAVPQDPASPTHLSAPEMQGRFALLMLDYNHTADALRLATDALRVEPANEAALRASALAALGMKDYAAALASADKLEQHQTLSGRGYCDNGYVLAGLRRAVAEKQTSLPVDVATLGHRATQAYERALAADPDNLRAWAGLADLYDVSRDVEAAKALRAKAEQVVERHPRNGPLVRALAQMCAATNQTDGAFMFAEIWRDNAVTDADRDTAEAFLSRLKAAPAGTAVAADHAATPQK